MAQWVIYNINDSSSGYFLFDETYGWKRWISGPESNTRVYSAQNGVKLDATETIGISAPEFNGIPTLVVKNGYYQVQ